MTEHTARATAPRAGDAIAASAWDLSAGAGAQAGAENFPVALRLLPRRPRAWLTAIYGFARACDDMGDEAPPEQRLALLNELEADVVRLYAWAPGLASAGGGAVVGGGAAAVAGAAVSGAAAPRLAVVRALAPLVTGRGVPARPFLDLIEANRQDQRVSRYATFADLAGYCRLSANPVGRLVLYAFGAATPDREALSDQICTALQLVEHWQDVAEDYRAGRIYLPGEDLGSFGCVESDLAEPSAAPRLRALLAFEVARARRMLDEGARLIGTLRGAARLAVAGYVAGGRAALTAISAADHDVLSATPRPARPRLAAALARAYLAGR